MNGHIKSPSVTKTAIIRTLSGKILYSKSALVKSPKVSKRYLPSPPSAALKTPLHGHIALAFVDNFIDSYDEEPKVIVLDFDDTDDIVNGDQQLALFNGYFSDYCFMPLHIYEGLSGKLISAILKPDKRLPGKNHPGDSQATDCPAA